MKNYIIQCPNLYSSKIHILRDSDKVLNPVLRTCTEKDLSSSPEDKEALFW